MSPTSGVAADQTIDQLGEQLCKALRALGQAGDPDGASQIAARAWWTTRQDAPAVAARINGTMHYLASLPNPTTRHPRNRPWTPTPPSTSATNRRRVATT